MDPLSQGALGAAAALIVAKPEQMRWAALLGTLSGTAPDLDVFIRSSGDPLFFLEYHRQFSHSLIFIPLGALLCSLIVRPLIRHRISNLTVYGFCLLGYGSHGLLDVCTSYGTQLLWPFSDLRIAWNNVAVVDPFFTLPLLIGVAVAAVRRSPRMARFAAIWAMAYLLVGVAQRERAESLGGERAASRGHVPSELVAKPAFGSLLLWKTIYEYEDRIYVDAARLGVRVRSFPGQSALKLDLRRDLQWLAPESQQARDIERFRWFSNGQLALDPAGDDRIIDVRYSMVPNRIEALWGIQLDRAAAPGAHADFFTSRSPSKEHRAEILRMLFE
jgi:inner membrane protein